MSRTALCVCAAIALTVAAAGTMAARIHFAHVDPGSNESTASVLGIMKRVLDAASVRGLPPDDSGLVELLLLFPIAALIIVVSRNVIGLTTFGTFTPALLGLAFRNLSAWPGVLAFVGIVLVGWFMRRILDRFHLLQVPRVSVMLCVVVSLLAAFIIASHRLGFATTRHLSLFPLVILTGMIERLWTTEEEDGVRASLRTLMATLSVSLFVGLLIGRPALGRFVVNFPESVGLTAAALMILGRYTGYRLTELYRFRELMREPNGIEPSCEFWIQHAPDVPKSHLKASGFHRTEDF